MKKVKVYNLISKEEIAQKVEEIGKKISADYKNKNPLLVGVLKGAWVFLADLVRHIDIPITCDFLQVSSYNSGTETTGVVKIISDLTSPIEGRDVIIVEDIVDTGLTLQYLIEMLELRKPNSLKICALLDKPARHRVEIKIDYLGFTIPNKFVVGYGIDFDEKFRNLPYIGYIEFEEPD